MKYVALGFAFLFLMAVLAVCVAAAIDLVVSGFSWHAATGAAVGIAGILVGRRVFKHGGFDDED